MRLRWMGLMGLAVVVGVWASSGVARWLYQSGDFTCHAAYWQGGYYTAAHCLEGVSEVRIGDTTLPTADFVVDTKRDVAFTKPLKDKLSLPKDVFVVEIVAYWGGRELRMKTDAHVSVVKDVPGLSSILHPDAKVLVLYRPVRSGFSGAPVFYKGRLVAVISCGDMSFTYAPLL